MSPQHRRPRQSVFRLRVELNRVEPTVWRRLLVPGSARMSKLAEMLLAAMGWSNSHLHAFRIGDARYEMNLEDRPANTIDEESATVFEALGGDRRFFFDYDFGDCWEHTVTVEDEWRTSTVLRFAVCLDGANACPPEDVGGASGYLAFRQAVADPTHEEHDAYLEWLGEPFDRETFDLALANARLQKVR
jgi:hypothetical protein